MDQRPILPRQNRNPTVAYPPILAIFDPMRDKQAIAGTHHVMSPNFWLQSIVY